MRRNPIARFAWISAALIYQSILFAGSEPPSDPVSSRVLQFTREHGHYVDAPMYPKNHPYWDELQWYRDQGAAVRPALMYLLTDEYRGEFGKMSDVIMALKNAPGSQADLLRFLRAELAAPPVPRPDDYYLLVNAAMSALSSFGDLEDLDLIRQFEGDDDVRIRINVSKYKEKLEERVSERSSDLTRRPIELRGQENETGSSRRAPTPDDPASTDDSAENGGSDWVFWTAGCVLVLALLFYFLSRRHNA